MPAQARLQQLRVNLQRLRDLMAQRIEDRYVLVNVPAFQLEAVERHQVELRHRVIAGKPERQTPTVRAQIRALNFFPYWRVPDSVAKLDLIPRLLKEPDYLQKEQIRVLTGSFNGPDDRLHQHRLAPGGRQPRSSSARTPARRTRWASCASTCRTSTASTCTTRR